MFYIIWGDIMKIFKKLFFYFFILFGLSLTVGCSEVPVTPVVAREEPIVLSMPLQEGIFVEKIGDGSMVLVKLNTDYGFKKYLEKGSKSLEEHIEYLESEGIDFYEKAMSFRRPFCTTYSAQYETGDYIFGRNNDLYPDDTSILLYTKPSDGYASVTMTDGVYFGYENENSNIEDIKKYMKAVAYFPGDGMNECGVAIAQNSVMAQSKIDPEKVSIGSLQAVRLVLDYAKDVDEAIELLEKYNIYFELSEQCHYLISDATGKSVIVEFASGEMKVLNSNYPWQVNTNFELSGFQDEKTAANETFCYRYKGAFQYLEKRNGILKENEPMDLLTRVVQNNTLYSTLYNKTSGDIQVAMRRKFNKIYQFKLEMK